jgi:hypothetical protein
MGVAAGVLDSHRPAATAPHANRGRSDTSLRPTSFSHPSYTIDDVLHDGDQMLLRLGKPPSPTKTLRGLGIPVAATRSAALRQLVL